MLPELHTVLLAQQYVVVLLLVYCITAIYRHENILGSLKPTPTKGKLLMFLSGMLPIPGRIVLCKSLIDSMTKSSGINSNTTAYICTHHYYLWSPLEKSVLILLGGLSLTYHEFITHMIVPIVIYTSFVVYYTFTLKLDMIDSDTEDKQTGLVDIILLFICLIVSYFAPIITIMLFVYLMYLYVKYKPSIRILTNIDYKTLMYVSLVLFIGCVVKHNIDIMHDILNDIDGDIYLAMLLSFIFSFILGSSSKFSGLCLLMTIIYGLEYMCLFYVIDFAGYYLSPTHKCTLVAQSGCKSGRIKFYLKLLCICVSMIVCTGLYTWFKV